MKRIWMVFAVLVVFLAITFLAPLAEAGGTDNIKIAPGKMLFEQTRIDNNTVRVDFGFGPGKESCNERFVTDEEKLMVLAGLFVYIYDAQLNPVTKKKSDGSWKHKKGTIIHSVCNGSDTKQAVLTGWQNVPRKKKK